MTALQQAQEYVGHKIFRNGNLSAAPFYFSTSKSGLPRAESKLNLQCNRPTFT